MLQSPVRCAEIPAAVPTQCVPLAMRSTVSTTSVHVPLQEDQVSKLMYSVKRGMGARSMTE